MLKRAEPPAAAGNEGRDRDESGKNADQGDPARNHGRLPRPGPKIMLSGPRYLRTIVRTSSGVIRS